ncbi:MAG: insulinase family protein [Ignavibacteria bacterium]|nr:insulinase family protein [Ignavibacteria bacterium]
MAISEIKKNAGTKSGILDRSKPPKSGKPKDVNFPKFFETKSSNGITALVIQDKRLPLVTSRFVFKSGAYLDHFMGESKCGLGSLTSEILTKGTESRNASMIAEEIDFLGAGLTSGCSYDATFVSSYSLKKYFDEVFDIMTDVILNPAFHEEELERSSDQRMNSLLSMIDDGDYLADKIFNRHVYWDSPYSYPIEGERASLKNITTGDLRNFYKKVFSPENLIVAFVGDISPDEALQKLENNFSEWNNNYTKADEIILPEFNKTPRVFLTDKKGAVQSSLKIGHLGIKRNNPDFITLSVMNTMLGGYFTSRINKNLREVNGYTYGARSVFSCYRYSGDFSVTTEVKTDITSETNKEILKELNEIKNKFVGKEELQNVKNYISGNFPMQLETPNDIASKAISLKLHGLEDDYYNTYIRKVNEITKEDIKEVAEKYLHTDRLIYSISGKSDDLKDKMQQFGEVEITEDIF